MTRPRTLSSALAAAAALAVVAVGAALTQGADEDALSTRAPAVAPAQERGASDGLPRVSAAELPKEARGTLRLIADGGPFPYDQDGTVFGNREGLLPQQRRGCYREYTVPTPGEDDRGARRIVTSCAGPQYWTADHYESFARIAGARL